MSGKIPDSANVAFEAVTLTHPHPLLQIFEKMRVLARQGPYSKATLSSRDQVGC